MSPYTPPEQATNGREPMFNIPGSILLFVVLIVGIEAYKQYFMTNESYFHALLQFSFIPARYGGYPPGLEYPMAAYWSPFTYAFMHGGWDHVLMNLLWMVAFGSAVAKRFGAPLFWAFTLMSAAAGAGAHWLAHYGEVIPVVGASACVSAFMGAASRFAFAPGMMGRPELIRQPALSLVEALSNRSFVVFVGIWFAVNYLFGSGIIPMNGDVSVAWQAHVGGFVFGLFAFPLFDPVGRQRNVD